MNRAIVDFIQALRHHGLPVSPAETLDALKATALIDIANRQRLKTTLCATLAKSLTHRGQLEALFDEFFAPIDAANSSAAIIPLKKDESLKTVTEDKATAITAPLGQLLLNNDVAQLHRQLVLAAEEAGAQEMQIFLQKNRVTTRILLAMGDRELQKELHQLETAESQLDLVAQLRQQRSELVDQIKDYVERQYLLFSGKRGQHLSEDTLQRVKLTHMDRQQQQRLAQLVQKIAKKLASLHSRRRKVQKRGQLNVRKTIAANAALDGYLVHTHWKSTRIERPRLMVICDVSGSVSAVARFLLLFVYSLQEVLPRVRSFVFSNEMAEVTNAFRDYPMDEALGMIMERWAHQSTDYGRALEDFTELALKQVDHKTQVIMLGDARNNYDVGRADIWKTVYTRAQRVLWLNPEDPSCWNTGDSIIREYAPYCSMLESCSSLRDMERILGRLLKYSQ